MQEKIITLYDKAKMGIVGLVIATETEKGHIRNNLTFYLEPELKETILPITNTFEYSRYDIGILQETIAKRLKTTPMNENITLLEPFVLESDNKNKSSRNKRMLEHMKLTHLERCEINDSKNKN